MNKEDIEYWITVNGNHIPVKKGQTKLESVNSFLKEKGDINGYSVSELKKRQTIDLLEQQESFDVYKGSKDIDKYQPNISYSKNVDNEEKKQAVYMYTTGKGLTDYVNINQYLNGTAFFNEEQKEKLNKAISQIDSCITSKTNKNMVVYRGIAMPKEKIGVGEKILLSKGFTSTSVSFDIAQEFADHYNGIIFEIQVPKGTRALGIGDNVDAFYDEAEVLFGRNAQLEVKEINGRIIKGVISYG